MRELKFRAWDLSKKIMYSAEQLGADDMQLHPNGKGFFNAHPSSPKLSGYFNNLLPLQYTGLKDVNGKEIFDGDILEDQSMNPFWRSKVEWGGQWKYCGFVLTGVVPFANERVEFSNDILNENWQSQFISVIGNIYETPELLK